MNSYKKLKCQEQSWNQIIWSLFIHTTIQSVYQAFKKMAINLLLAKEIPQSKQNTEIINYITYVTWVKWGGMFKNIASLANMRQSGEVLSLLLSPPSRSLWPKVIATLHPISESCISQTCSPESL